MYIWLSDSVQTDALEVALNAAAREWVEVHSRVGLVPAAGSPELGYTPFTPIHAFLASASSAIDITCPFGQELRSKAVKPVTPF
jgi:hypothetical protein